MSKEKRNYQQLHQISSATLIEESSHLRLVMQGIIITAIVVIALIGWAAFSSIKEVSVTYGEVIPKGKVHIVQHLEGGIVSKVLVNNGDEVKKGEVMIEMSPQTVQAELSQLRARDTALMLDKSRLTAFLNNKMADLNAWSQKIVDSKYNTVSNPQEIASLLHDEEAHLKSQYKTIEDQRSILTTGLKKKKEQLNEVNTQVRVIKRQIELLNEEFEMYQKLKKDNYISHRDYLIVLRELNQSKGEHVRLQSQVEQVKKEIEEADFKLNELQSTTREAALKELGLVNNQLLETHHKIEKLEDQLNRLAVKAPINGVVKGVAVFAGNVVQPGATLLEVVPVTGEMLVESKVNPRDIGHINVGDPVKVKVLTYDFARYGSISGKLTNISASTFENKEGQPYYQATVSLDKQYFEHRNGKKYLKPGMTVQADIVTGQKTILQYLLKPVHRAGESAFRER